MQQESRSMEPTFEAISEPGMIRFGDYLRRAWRRKFIVIIPALLMLAAGFLYIRHDLSFSTPMYRSVARLEERLPQTTAEISGEEVQRFTRTERETFFSMVYRMRSRVANSPTMVKLWEDRGLIDPNRPPSLLQRLGVFLHVRENLTKEEIKGAQIRELSDQLKAEPSDTARIFDISFPARDRTTAREVVLAATDMLLELYKAEVATLGSQSQAAMQLKVDELENERSKIKNLIVDFQVTNPGIDPLLIESYIKRSEASENNLTKLEADLVGYESDLRTVVLRLKAVKLWKEGEEPTNPLKEAIEKKEEEVRVAEARLTRNHPDLQRLLADLKFMKKELADKERAEKEKKAKPAAETKVPVRTDADVYKDNRRLLEAELDHLNNEKRVLHAERTDIYNKYANDPTLVERNKKELQERYDAIGPKVFNLKQRMTAKENVLDALRPGMDLAALRLKFKDAPVEGISLESLPKAEAKGEIEEAEGAPRRLPEFTEQELQKLSDDYVKLASDREKLIRQIQQTMNQIDIASEDLRRVTTTLNRFPIKAVDLANLRKEEEALIDRIKFMNEKLKPVEIRTMLEENQLGRRLAVLREASMPGDPFWPPPYYLILPISLLVGMVLGVIVITALEMIDHSFWRSSMVEERLRLPVLATIPMTPVDTVRWPGDAILFQTSRQQEAELAAMGEKKKRFGRGMLKRLRRRTVATEQFRKLRLRLTGGFQGERVPRTILITSSIPEEGKTAVATNLAAAVSQRIGEHVLLVDCDLRRPAVHTYFNVQNGQGLSDYLQYKAELPQLLVKTAFDKLTILPAGNGAQNPAEMLASERMKNLVKEMKSRYADRIIIFDSPPLLATADPNVLASQVDGILLVIEAGRTPQEIVETALSSLEGQNVLGAVLNAAKYEITSYFYPRPGE